MKRVQSIFSSWEKRNQIKKEIKKLQRNGGSFTTNDKEILGMQANFYENLYDEKQNKSKEELNNYMETTKTPKLLDEEKNECEGLLTNEECRAVLKTFNSNKSPGNDGLTIEFYRKFWPIFGQLMMDSFNCAYSHGELSVSQRQAVITLLDKGKNRYLLKNWRPISLLNVDYKIASKALANRMIKFLPKLIHENQVGYVKDRNIADNIRTIVIYLLT